MVPRLIALGLAVPATLWGLLVFGLFLFEDWPSAQFLFGPGYLVTMGYWWRACTTPSLAAARGIWILSIVVQGAWLVWMIVSSAGAESHVYGFDALALQWWLIATSLSIMALFIEGKGQATQDMSAGQ